MSPRGGGDKRKAGVRRARAEDAQDHRTDERREPGDADASESADAPLWRRLVTAVRGGISELGEVVADGQALRILDQEIRDADAELALARLELGELRAHYKVALDRQQATAAKVLEYEAYALKALKANDEPLAREVAAKVAKLEAARDADAAEAERHKVRIEAARKAIAQRESNIRRLRQQVDTVRATENMQRAQATLAHRRLDADGRLQTALQALERIRWRQLERGARLDTVSARDADEDALEQKLRRAGILDAEGDATDAVLARLKRRRRD